MAILDHPTLADLLLWQSGELNPKRAEELRRHIAECAECQAKIAELESLYEGIAAVDDHAAQYSIREAIQERHRRLWRRWQLNPRWIAVTATVVIVVLLIVTLTEGTPSARAEALLSRAVKEEGVETDHSRFFQIQSSGLNCNVVVSHTAAVVSSSNSNQSFCGRLSTNLHAAGWDWSDLLSARSFKQWRASLKEKKDAIGKLSNASEITTTTTEGPLHRATLRLRSADYRVEQASFVFASTHGEEEPEFEVTESDVIPQEIAAVASSPRPEAPRPPQPPSLPPADPVDITEAEVRLALHRIGADKNVLLTVNREAGAVKVTGIVPGEAQASSITNALDGLPQVEIHVVAEGEDEPSTGWQTFHGDAPPLAYDQVNALYANNQPGRQRFVNNIDALTLRLAGETKSREGLLALANRLRPYGKAEQLSSALADMESSMSTDLDSLVFALHPLIGPVTPQAAHLTYTQATQLYIAVHELVSMNKSDNPLDLDGSLSKARRLISGK